MEQFFNDLKESGLYEDSIIMILLMKKQKKTTPTLAGVVLSDSIGSDAGYAGIISGLLDSGIQLGFVVFDRYGDLDGLALQLSFTYGAGEMKLAEDIRKKTSVFTLGVGVVFTVAMILLAAPYCGMFLKEAEVRKLAVRGIYIFVVSFLISGYNVIASFFFTSISPLSQSFLVCWEIVACA